MAKTPNRTGRKVTAKKKKKKILPKSPNGHRRVHVSFALWGYEKETLRRIARHNWASMSYELNMHLLGATWFRGMLPERKRRQG